MSKEMNETRAEIIERFARHVSSGKAAYFAQAGIDFIGGERESIYLDDLDGKRLINCHCNGGVFNLGHRNPRIMDCPAKRPGELRHRQPSPDERAACRPGEASCGHLAW